MLPEAEYDPVSRVLKVCPEKMELKGNIAVCTGGTADIPVAEEAAQTAEFFECYVNRIYDVGVAGIHRILSRRDEIVKANCIVAVAGMEGALGTVSYTHLDVYKRQLLAVTDQGLNTYPDLEGKKALIQNAVKLLHSIGIEEPKVAVLAAVEKVNPKMPESVDGAELKKMNENGEITGCIVEGPISFDLAVKQGAAAIKGYESPVAGDADLLVVPDIACGNILVKCMTDYAGALTAGTILGAKVPVIVTSRSAEATDKYYSIALAAYSAAGY